MRITLAEVEAVLRNEDIEGLVESGAPRDEYDSEAREIAGALASLSSGEFTETNITAIIALVWAKSFNRSEPEIRQRIPAFQRIAHLLCKS
jgi:hypothetical protein